jgi:predicted GTPase
MRSKKAKLRLTMNKIKHLFLLLAQMSGGRWGIASVSAVLPILVMIIFAIFLAIKYDYILVLSVTIALSTLLISVPLFIINQIDKKNQDEVALDNSQIADGFVKVSAEWSQNEVLIWQKSKQKSRHLLAQNNEWSELDQVGLDILEFVASEFGKKALDFSIPEGLQLLGEISRRYKVVIKQYIPAVEMLKVSHLKEGYAAYEQYGELGAKAVKIAIWANYAKNLYLNPAKFAADIIKDQSTSTMTKGLVENMQNQAKRALLDEVASVAIDLYSGRFSFAEDEVLASVIASEDVKRIAPALEPIRIVFVGQTSVGKSSIINLLKEQLVAEVDVLPSTDNTTVYEAILDDIPIRVVDQQGLDGDIKTQQLMLAEMTQADLIVWVLKANQPARELDKTLKAEFDAYYTNSKHISRKKAALVGVVNQVDKLKPIEPWQPPYNIAEPTCAKAKIINQALVYNQKVLKLDVMLALSIDPDKQSFGVAELKHIIIEAIANASNVQRNRQRVEAMKKGIDIKQQVKRALHSGKNLYPNILRNAAPEISDMLIKKFKK